VTTIAYREGVLAADSMLSGNDTNWGSVSKLIKSKHGAIGGAVGRLESTLEFLAWLELFDPAPATDRLDFAPVCDGADGLIITRLGRLLLWTGGRQLVLLEAPFTAIGTGAKIAMGAMAAGAGAEQAVRIAREYDVYTGGRIVTLRNDAHSSPQSRSIAQ